MGTISSPAVTGRLFFLTNLTNRRLGVAGTVIGPNKTLSVPARQIYGHRTHMATMQALVQQGKLKVVFENDTLSEAEVAKIDAPLSGDLYVARDIFTDPVNSVDDAVKASWTATAAANTYASIWIGDFARNLIVTATTGGGQALTQKTFTFNGTDIDGHPLSESLVVGALGASSSHITTAIKAFKSVVSIYVPGDPSGSPGAYKVGFGNTFGLSHTMSQGVLLSESYDNGAPGGAGTLVFAAASPPYGTWTPFDTPNGAHDWILVYLPL